MWYLRRVVTQLSGQSNPGRHDPRGETIPYTLLGPVTYVEHRRGRPMQITWELATPMPGGLYQETKVAAG